MCVFIVYTFLKSYICIQAKYLQKAYRRNMNKKKTGFAEFISILKLRYTIIVSEI